MPIRKCIILLVAMGIPLNNFLLSLPSKVSGPCKLARDHCSSKPLAILKAKELDYRIKSCTYKGQYMFNFLVEYRPIDYFAVQTDNCEHFKETEREITFED